MSFVEERLDHHRVHQHPTDLFLGELPNTWDVIPAQLVLNFCGDLPTGERGGRRCFVHPLLDMIEPSQSPDRSELESFLDRVAPFVESEASYWHCHAGINRASLAVAAHLHLYRGLSISDAIETLRARRSPMVLWNYTFEGLLRSWYGTAEEQVFSPVDARAYRATHNK